MIAGARPRRRRSFRLAVSGCCALALAACTAGDGPAATDQYTVAEEPDAAAVTAAREALGAPTVTLADALLTTAAAADAARHTTPRGAETGAAATALGEALPALRDAALAADAAARPLTDGPDRIRRAAELVSGAAAAGLRAADDGAAQAAAVQRLSEFDTRLADAVGAWDQPGSQSARRTALTALAGELEALAAEATAEPAVPEGCPAPRDARVRRATLLAERTRSLAATANSAGGERYDAERAAFAADPYGEDPLAVDAADRDCWGEQSVLAQAAAGVRGEVETLESLLQP